MSVHSLKTAKVNVWTNNYLLFLDDSSELEEGVANGNGQYIYDMKYGQPKNCFSCCSDSQRHYGIWQDQALNLESKNFGGSEFGVKSICKPRQ